jgi:hydrogenase expression/formation protein HypC
MCLALPGEIIEITNDEPLARTGKVSFSGIIKEINLTYVPEAGLGDYVIVHVGFAISKLHKEEALKVFEYLEQIDELGEISYENKEI